MGTTGLNRSRRVVGWFSAIGTKLAAAAMMLHLGTSLAMAQGYTVTTGPGVLISPAYEGAKNSTVGPLPWLSVRPDGTPPRYIAPDDSIGIGLVSGSIGVGFVGALRGKRDATGERIGLSPVNGAFELGLSFDYWPADWVRTRIEVKRGLSGHSGWVADLGADAFMDADPFIFVLGPRLGLGDKTYMNKYFAVTSAEAAANPFVSSAYSPSGGLRYFGAAGGIIHRHVNWQELAGIAWHRLSGNAADSPMVSQVGAADQFIITFGIMYSFSFGN